MNRGDESASSGLSGASVALIGRAGWRRGGTPVPRPRCSAPDERVVSPRRDRCPQQLLALCGVATSDWTR